MNDASPQKLIIYQVLPRLFTNTCPDCVPDGTLARNGSGKLNDYTLNLLRSIAGLGVNCIWYTGIIEHATKTDFTEAGIELDNPNVVKGEAGSPYAIKDYYDVDPALATVTAERMDEWKALIGRTHDAGLKCIIDFVPNHTARRYHSDSAPAGTSDFGAGDDTGMFFTPHNNYYYIPNQQFAPDFPLDSEGGIPYVEFPAKATGNDCFTAFCTRNDWYETVKLNYGLDYNDRSAHFDPIPDTWLKMRDILLFWASTGVDGFRCDMVFMVPLEFWHWVIPEVRRHYPHVIFIGEIYDVSLYRPFLTYGCFDYLYDKVSLYDTLVGIETGKYSAARITGCWQTVDGIGGSMLNFLENHDEVRYASAAYAGRPDTVLPALVVSSMISTGPMMIYFGQELGEPARDNEGFAGDNNRTTIFDYWSYDTMRRWYNDGGCDGAMLTAGEQRLRDMYSRVLHLCNDRKAISEGGFFDLMYVNLDNPGIDPHRQFVFIRHHRDDRLLIAVNFDDKAVTLDVNIPQAAFDMCGLPDTSAADGTYGKLTATDLLTGDKMSLTLSPGCPASMRVGARGAVVLAIEDDRHNSDNQSHTS